MLFGVARHFFMNRRRVNKFCLLSLSLTPLYREVGGGGGKDLMWFLWCYGVLIVVLCFGLPPERVVLRGGASYADMDRVW